MLSAICFNLDQSKILLSGNVLKYFLFPNFFPEIICTCSISLQAKLVQARKAVCQPRILSERH